MSRRLPCGQHAHNTRQARWGVGRVAGGVGGAHVASRTACSSAEVPSCSAIAAGRRIAAAPKEPCRYTDRSCRNSGTVDPSERSHQTHAQLLIPATAAERGACARDTSARLCAVGGAGAGSVRRPVRLSRCKELPNLRRAEIGRQWKGRRQHAPRSSDGSDRALRSSSDRTLARSSDAIVASARCLNISKCSRSSGTPAFQQRRELSAGAGRHTSSRTAEGLVQWRGGAPPAAGDALASCCATRSTDSGDLRHIFAILLRLTTAPATQRPSVSETHRSRPSRFLRRTRKRERQPCARSEATLRRVQRRGGPATRAHLE